MTLGEAYPLEQQRVRELLSAYKSIGQSGLFGAAMLEDVLQRADQAAISGDVDWIMAMYKEMKGCE